MAWSSKKDSLLDRRLRELQDEQQQLRRHIKTISRALKNQDDLADLPRRVPLAPPAVRAGSRRPGPPAPAEEGSEENGDPETVRPVEAGSRPASPVKSDGRFANYFTVGSVNGLRPLRHEKALQRNKALFMIFVVLVVAFVVYKLLP
jgi:hypothetical protein